MEINPSLARLRILEAVDSVALQREASPDGDQAGCPGCPYFWSCPVPHRSSDVAAESELYLDDVAPADADDDADRLPRRAFVPRDERDIGWSDMPDGRAPADWDDDPADDDEQQPRRRWWRRRG